MAKRLSSEEILANLQADDDGLPTRPIGLWTLEKLAILLLYFRGFTSASKDAGGGVYIDGFAGPGVGRVRGATTDPRFVWGSPLLAARTTPQFARCLFVESKASLTDSLTRRLAFAETRTSVVVGDSNDVLSTLLRSEVHALAPCFCLLDPEGTELNWSTVEAIANTPGRKRNPELLILFPSSSLLRLLPRHGKVDPSHERALGRLMPNKDWKGTYGRRLTGHLAPSTAKDEYVEQYRRGLESLGYKAFSHPVTAPSMVGGTRRERYCLVFATQHPAGQDIMLDVFRRPYVLDFPVTRQRPLFEN